MLTRPLAVCLCLWLWLLLWPWLSLVGCGKTMDVDAQPGSICSGIRFTRQDYMSRSGFNYGDSWMMSCAGDGRIFTNFSDGKLSMSAPKQTNALLAIADDPPRLAASSFVPISGDPLMIADSWAHYIISTIFIDTTMYAGIIGLTQSSGIARSDDFGRTLVYDRTRPMWPADGKKAFAYPSFLQNGAGYKGNLDGKMYVYASDGNWGEENRIRLARVATSSNHPNLTGVSALTDVTQYEYWNGDGWSADLATAADLLVDGRNLGGMQSIVYNPPLGRYFLITFGDTHYASARMVMYDAPEPWGQWSRCGAIFRYEALFTDEPLHSYVYNPSFNAKWIEPDGGMWISYANCCADDAYSFHYGLVSVISK